MRACDDASKKICYQRRTHWSFMRIITNDCQFLDSFLISFIDCHFVCLPTRRVVYCFMSSHWETISDALSENGSRPSHSNWEHAVCLLKPCWFSFWRKCGRRWACEHNSQNGWDVKHKKLRLRGDGTKRYLIGCAKTSCQNNTRFDICLMCLSLMIRREESLWKKSLKENEGRFDNKY